MKKLIILLALLLSFAAQAQKFPFYKHNKWEKKPKLINRHLDDPIYYYNQYDIVIEYIFDDTRGVYNKFETNHYRVFLNTDAAVDEFNKVYISLEDVHNVLNLKARLIKSDKVVDLDLEIEEFYNEDDNEEYYYFPISGMEVGDELEVFYTLKMSHAMNGDQILMQGEYPMYNSSFYLITPKYFKFNFETYNGYPKPEKIDTILQVTQYYAHLDSVPAFKSEYFSEYNNSIYKIDVSLYSIEDKGYFDRYYPYERTVSDLNKYYNQPIKGGVKKKVLKQLKALGYDESADKETKIRFIENYIKININFSSKFEDIGVLATIENKRSSFTGIIKLYKILYDVAEIEYNYGYTSDRYETYFSDEIESDYFLQNYIFYFPDVKMYLSPLDFSTRLGFVSTDLVPNNALLLLEEVKTGIRKSDYKVEPIYAIDYKKNYDSTVMHIKLADNLIDMDIEIEVYAQGYKVGDLQAYYYLYSPDNKDEEMKDLLNFMGDNSTYKVSSIENVKPEDAYVKPLIVKGKITHLYTHILEKADQKTIIKLGNIFGDGLELKEILDRKTDFTFGYAYHATKTIIIDLPKGVKVSRLVNIQEFDQLVDLDGFSMSSKINVTDERIVYVKSNAFKKQRYSVKEKEKMAKIFQFYNDIANMNIILE